MANKIYAAAHAISLFSEDGLYSPPFYKSALADTIMKNSKQSTVSYKFTNKVMNGPYYNLNRFLSYLRHNNYGRWITPEPRTVDITNFDFRPYVDMKGGDKLTVDTALTLFPSADYFIKSYVRNNIPYAKESPYTIISEVPPASQGGNVVISNNFGHFTIPIPPYDPNEQYLFVFYDLYNTQPNHVGTSTTYKDVPDFEDPGLGFEIVSSNLDKLDITYQNTVTTSRDYENEILDDVAETDVTDITVSFDSVKEEWRKVVEVGDEDNLKKLTTDVTHTTNYIISPTETISTVSGVENINGVDEPYTDTITTVKNELIIIRTVKTEIEEIVNSSIVGVGSLIYKRNSGTPGLDALFGDRERGGFIPKMIMLKRDGFYFIPENSGVDPIAKFNKVGLKRWFRKDSVYSDLIQELGKGDAYQIDNMSIYPCIDTGRDTKALLLYMFHAGMYLIEKYNVKPDEPFEQIPVYSKRQRGFHFDLTLEGYIDKPNLVYKGYSNTWQPMDNLTDADFSIEGDNISYATSPKYARYHVGNGRYNHNGRLLRTGEIVRVPQSVEVRQRLNYTNYYERDNGGYTGVSAYTDARVGTTNQLLSLPMSVSQNRGGSRAYNAWSIVYQREDNRWERMEVWTGGLGMIRLNWMSGDLEVHAPDNSEGIIGFPLPIIEDVLHRMPIIHANDVAQYSQYVLAHSWKKVKKKWYQTALFKIVVIVVAIIAAVWTGGSSLSTASGILGTNAAVGAAIGLTGTAAILVGAVVNTVAAMIVANIISRVAGKLLGAELGQLVALVSMFLISNWNSIGDGSFNLSDTFNDMLSMDNLMKSTLSIMDGIATKMNTDTQNMLIKGQFELDELEKQEKEVLKKIEGLYSNTILDPLNIAEYTSAVNQKIEPSTVFLSRTLMTGTDLINIQIAMIEDFVDLNLDLKSDMNGFDV